MNLDYVIEERVIERAMATYPEIKELVEFSTPVVSFGYPSSARMVTVGINPSSLEFLTPGKNKKILPANKKKLVDLETLRVKSPKALDREQAIKVIEGCYSYFNIKPYDWFDHLNRNVNSYFKCNYRDGSAAHLDLVQWATDPVWGNIEDESIKSGLLQGDVDFLRYQINTKKFEVIFLNGRQVFEQLTRHKIVEAVEADTVTYLTKTGKLLPVTFYQGQSQNGSCVLGWSRTFPGHHISGEALPGIVEKLHNHFERFKK
ncbi:hypothetical protein MCEPAE42_00498 [Candidatus Nanopelagicaceae bacterium]